MDFLELFYIFAARILFLFKILIIMKKFLSVILFMAAMSVTVFSITACGDDEDEIEVSDNSSIVGTWEIVKAVYYADDEEPEYEDGYGAYWVFTKKTCTLHDPEDLMNGKTVNYTFDGKKLRVEGFPLYNVVELTSTRMVLRSDPFLGSYTVLTLKKES